MDKRALSERISKAFFDKREAIASEIVSGIRVDTTRTSIKAAPFVRALDELKAIELSPLVAGRICLDSCATYEFWHDTNGESVNYVLQGPIGDVPPDHPWPQDHLGRWMISFQSRLPTLLAEAADRGR